MKKFILKFWRAEDISRGVRTLTTATAVRWFGWGFAETLIPVILFSFAKTYAETGLLKSAYDIALIISLPLVGLIADRMRGTTLVLIGLALYVIVGAGYLLAGVTGLAIFIIVARLFNGVGYSFDSVGRETYFRRHTPKEKTATIFGYFDTVANFWWIVAALLGIILVKYFSVYLLLFLIVPTVLIAMYIVWRFARKEPVENFSKEQTQTKYRDLWREVVDWNWKLKLLTILNFFISFAYTAVIFFLPIQVYAEGANFTPVIIMGVVMTIPMLFGYVLGNFFDGNRRKIFTYGIIGFAVLLICLGFVTGYVWQIIIAFLIGVVIELLYVGSNELVTVYANPEHFGRVSGLSKSFTNIGAMVGPIVVGIIIDSFGTSTAYFSLATMMIVLAGVFVVGNRINDLQKSFK